MAQRKVSAKFELDGEKAYKNAVKEINDSLRVLNAEMKLTTASFADNADGLDALEATYDVQQRTALTLKEKVAELENAVHDCAAAYGEADSRTKGFQTSLLNAQTELVKQQQAMETTREKIDTCIKGMEAWDEQSEAFIKAANEAADAESNFAEAVENFTETANSVEPATSRLDDSVTTLADTLKQKLPNGAQKAIDKLGILDPKIVVVAGSVTALAAACVKAEKALINMTKESASRADELLKLSSVSGVSAENLQKFEYAADFVGISSDALTDSLKDLTKNMADAANGNENYAAKFENLGVSITNTDGSLRDSYEVFLDVVDALGRMENVTERDAAAMGLINESAQQLNPLIEAGTDALRKYSEEAENLGAVLSEDELEALNAVDDAQKKLLKTQEAVTDQISAQYAPHMEKALNKTSELVQSLGEKLVASGVVDNFGLLLEFTTELLDPLASLADAAIPAVAKALDVLNGSMAWVLDAADALAAILTLDFTKFNTALGLNMNRTGEMSHIQQWRYGSGKAESGGWVQDESGKWVANGYNAGGTDNWRGGWTRVGEAGPETVYLPQGASIQTAQESRASGGVYIANLTVDASSLQSMQQITEFFNNLERYARMGG